MSEDQPLTRKVALVTGGSRGVGKGVVEELALQGATVYVTGRTVARWTWRTSSRNTTSRQV